jgi:hypothetical protein
MILYSQQIQDQRQRRLNSANRAGRLVSTKLSISLNSSIEFSA